MGITYSPKQIALLHYRVTGAELYKKLRTIEFSTHNIRQHTSDAERLDFLQTLDYGQRLGFNDATDAFQRIERVLASENNGVSALAVYFCNMPTVMTVGGFFPEFDYSCRWMQQPLGTEDRCDGISFSILSSEGRAALCMTWLKGDEIPEKFARSFVEQKPELYTTLAIQTAFEHLENTCTSISWWDSLKSVEQRSLLMRMQLAGSVFEERKSDCLSFDGIKHDDWVFDRYELLNV